MLKKEMKSAKITLAVKRCISHGSFRTMLQHGENRGVSGYFKKLCSPLDRIRVGAFHMSFKIVSS
jgi:hypothetical protein